MENYQIKTMAGYGWPDARVIYILDAVPTTAIITYRGPHLSGLAMRTPEGGYLMADGTALHLDRERIRRWVDCETVTSDDLGAVDDAVSSAGAWASPTTLAAMQALIVGAARIAGGEL